MTTTRNKFSLSTNILRDKNIKIDYVSTRNANNALASILGEYKRGVRSYVIIGAYGTGKSSFLVALRQTLSKETNHFSEHDVSLRKLPEFEFIDVVGEYSSLEENLSELLSLDGKKTAQSIIRELEKKRKLLQKKGKGLVLVIDEFGKFLEYAAKNSPESELYLIQQIAEWVNNPDNNCLLVCTLHQDFSTYSLQLTRNQRLEWDKVKGRLKELPFNEPVEQLLLLAANRIEKKYSTLKPEKNFDKLFSLIESAKAFPFKNHFDKEVAKKLYPFDILSAALLTLSLQKYGQNERSLFSFIESNASSALGGFESSKKPYYSISSVYDYLLNEYYTYINSKYNPHFNQWSSIRRAIEKIDGAFESSKDQLSAEELIKAIGLINIFASTSAKLEPNFYFIYGQLALGIENSVSIIELLEKKKIIRYVKHSVKYILSEGTDVDIELAIDDAGRIVEKVSNVVQQLSQIFEFPFISAKSNVYKSGTPRYFQFKLTESPIQAMPEGEIDGFINLVFAEGESAQEEICKHSKNCTEAILFGFYKNTGEIKNILFEIQKIKKAKEINSEDKIAVRELNSIQDHYIKLLNHRVLNNIYSDSGNIVWYSMGTELTIPSRQKFNNVLSIISGQVYHQTPCFRNEMVNRTKVSSQIAFARRKLLDRLVNNLDEKNIGFLDNEFPPEKSIYLSLLLNTGIHRVWGNSGRLSRPSEASFLPLWEAGIKFLDITKNKERKLTELIEILSIKPFKLKEGFIDFWLPIFLLANSHEYALYESGIYIPEINTDVLELINKRPSLFTIKAFDVAGVKLDLFKKYRAFLNQSVEKSVTSSSFIETIKPFLVFYKDLPESTKKTQRWLGVESIAIRNVISNAKDPEKTFFEGFPTALGFSNQDFVDNSKAVGEFITRLKSSIKELQGCHDNLVNHFENYFISEVLGYDSAFPDYKSAIAIRYQNLKVHLLLPAQKTFSSRLLSELDDRKAWLSSIAQTLIGKPLNNVLDDDLDLLYQKLKDTIHELDNLCDLSENPDIANAEDIFRLELTSIKNGLSKKNLLIPKSKASLINKKVSNIKSTLGHDNHENLIIITKLLQELLNNGE